MGLDRILDVRSASGTWTAQDGKNAARHRIAPSAVSLQVSMHLDCF